MNTKIVKFATRAALGFALLCTGASAYAQAPFATASRISNMASTQLVEGSVSVVRGGSEVLAGGANLVIASVAAAGEGSVMVLRDVAGLSEVLVRTSANGLRNVAVGVGDAVQVVAATAGHMLVSAGAVIAFIPNEVGHSLLHAASAK